MNATLTPEDLGEPHLKVGGFQLWVHRKADPDAVDCHDREWLFVTACCLAPGASVWVRGSIVTLMDIARFGEQCRAVQRGASRSAVLDPPEPELMVSLEVADQRGHIRATVEITPEHLKQSHTMEFEIDQSYLTGIINQCSAIVEAHPIR